MLTTQWQTTEQKWICECIFSHPANRKMVAC